MEHFVGFTISIDDKKIEDQVLNKAVKEITRELTSKVEKIIYENSYGYNRRASDLSGAVVDRVDAFLKENREDILDRAASKLADKMARMKVVKEKVEEIVAQI